MLKKYKEKYMAIFKCKKTGNTVEFKQEHDVKQMREHEGYEEVVPVEKKPVKKQEPKE